MFPKNVLEEINKIVVPEDKIKEIDPAQWEGVIHELIKFEIMKLGERLGYFSIPEFYLPGVHGTIESGTVDVIWADINQSCLSFAFEIERRTPRKKTLLKLKHLKNLVKHRVVLIYDPVWGPDHLGYPPDYMLKFVRDGISIIANWPTLPAMFLQKCEWCKEKLEESGGSEIEINRIIQSAERIKDKNKGFRLVSEEYLKLIKQIFREEIRRNKILGRAQSEEEFLKLQEQISIEERIKLEDNIKRFLKVADYMVKKESKI
jgi:hypothetical protein